MGTRGTGGWVALLYIKESLPDLDASQIPSTHTTSAEPVQKRQRFAGQSIAVVPELCHFHEQKIFFCCDVNFFTDVITFRNISVCNITCQNIY